MWPFKCCAKSEKNTNSTIEDSDAFSLKLAWSVSAATEGFSLDAYLGNQAIGKAHGTYEAGKEYRLTKIDVFAPHKGKGYGTIMIYTLIGAAKTKKCTKFIFEGVSDTNVDAVRLYTKHGARASTPKLCNDKADYEISL